MKRLVLIGGGHAHLFVLRHLAAIEHQGIEVTMVTPEPWQHYSGMLPGWMSGHYALDDIRVDLERLAAAAGARLLFRKMVALDADHKCVRLSDGQQLRYDLLSLDIGSETKRDWLEDCGRRLVTVKPIDEFARQWETIICEAAARDRYDLAVVGGGAAGVELAFAAWKSLSRKSADIRVHLVTGAKDFLRGHSPKVKALTLAALGRAGIVVHAHRAAGTASGLLLSSGANLPADCVLAATGASAPVVLRTSRLALDAEGFVQVDNCHRSLSHPEVFAAGDVCSMTDRALQRSGVHAVRAGPVLAENLTAALWGRPLRPHRPRNTVLYIIACGGKTAIASWGRFNFQGRWVWRWKDYIDRKFMQSFSI